MIKLYVKKSQTTYNLERKEYMGYKMNMHEIQTTEHHMHHEFTHVYSTHIHTHSSMYSGVTPRILRECARILLTAHDLILSRAACSRPHLSHSALAPPFSPSSS